MIPKKYLFRIAANFDDGYITSPVKSSFKIPENDENYETCLPCTDWSSSAPDSASLAFDDDDDDEKETGLC